MLVIDPNHRISTNDALSHPYVQNVLPIIDAPVLQAYDSNVEAVERKPHEWKSLLTLLNFP